MNKVILTGRITRDLELRSTESGSKVCEFTLATNRPVVRDGERKADFINCIVWNKQAENLCKYQGKGSLIAIQGELRVDSYEIEGSKRYKTYVLGNGIEFLSKKETKEEKVEENNPYAEFGEKVEFDFGEQIEIEDSDLPWEK